MKPLVQLKTEDIPLISSGTSQVFLFSKTFASSHALEKSRLSCPSCPEPIEDHRNNFTETFPDVPIGRDFIDVALNRMPHEGFSVLLFRPDCPSRTDARASLELFMQDAGFILEEMIQPYHAVWGLLDAFTLGCVLPEADLSICRNFGYAFQEKLTVRRKNSAYIGMAAHPLLAFNREDAIDNAWKALIHASMLGPGNMVVIDAVSLNISGDSFYQDGDLGGAISEYQSALMLDPQETNVHNSLGVCYGMLGNYESAAAEFDIVLGIKPDEVMALYNRALIYLLAEDKEMARNFVEKALAEKDDIFEIVLLAGKLYLENGEFDKALSFLEKAVSHRPKSGVALRSLGACLIALARPQDAVVVYSRVVRTHPNDAESLSELGILYDQIGENPEIARLFCRQSVALAPDNEIYRERLHRLEGRV